MCVGNGFPVWGSMSDIGVRIDFKAGVCTIILTGASIGVPIAAVHTPQVFDISTDAPLAFPASAMNDLTRDLDKWGGYLRGIGRKANTIKGYRQSVDAAVRGAGWESLDRLTLDAVATWLGSERDKHQWTGSTYNRHLAAFRSLTDWARKTRRVPENLLEDSDSAKEAKGGGNGPMTPEQIRAILAYTAARQAIDKRCRTNRLLYWYMLFYAGMRFSEPAKFHWRNVLLDEPVPVFVWEPGMHKAGRRCEIAVHPILVPMLRAQQAKVPHGPNDHLFPTNPPRQTFRADRRGAGIPAVDSRGRPLAPHSFRKSFRSFLMEAGVHGDMIDFLIRHSRGVSDTYSHPSLEAQVACLSRLVLSGNNSVDKGLDKVGETSDTAVPIVREVHMSTIQCDTTLTTGESHVTPAIGNSGDAEGSPVLNDVLRFAVEADDSSTAKIHPRIDLAAQSAGKGLNNELADVLESAAALQNSIAALIRKRVQS